MPKGNVAFFIGIISIIVGVGALVFIFLSIGNLAEKCKAGLTTSSVCGKLKGPSIPLITVVLIIAGLVLIVSTTAYILLSAKV